jgi:hypothetical protein
MCVGGWIANELEWKRLECLWQKRIDFQNAHCQPNQKISRFHASYLNAYGHEFKNWDKAMSIRFSKKLIALISKRKMGAICVGTDMSVLKNVFPDGKSDRRSSTYTLCMKQIMVDIGHIMREHFPGDQVLLIHDHGDWDTEALAGYNMMVDDIRWEPRHHFLGLVSMTWRQAIGLQAADLIVYEIFKRLKSKVIDDSEKIRAPLRQLANNRMPISAKYINEAVLEKLRRLMGERST